MNASEKVLQSDAMHPGSKRKVKCLHRAPSLRPSSSLRSLAIVNAAALSKSRRSIMDSAPVFWELRYKIGRVDPAPYLARLATIPSPG